MIACWIEAFALVSSVHGDEFERACMAALGPQDAIIFIERDLVRARVRNPHEDGLLLMALPGDLGQRCRVGAGRYWFPVERWRDVHEATERHGVHIRVVSSLLYRLELRHRGLIGALRAGLLRRAPTFGPTYPRIAAA